MGRGDGVRPKEVFQLLSDCSSWRHIQDAQQVVTKELATPYATNYLVLTPETRLTRTMDRDPSMEERLVMVVWQLRSSHLSTTVARYMVRSMMYGVVREQVYGMLSKLAPPDSRAFIAHIGDNTAIHRVACYLPDRLAHLYKCRLPPLGDIMQARDRWLHWLCIAVDRT